MNKGRGTVGPNPFNKVVQPSRDDSADYGHQNSGMKTATQAVTQPGPAYPRFIPGGNSVKVGHMFIFVHYILIVDKLIFLPVSLLIDFNHSNE